MADHVLDRGRLTEAVGNDIADMAQFWMLRKFQFFGVGAHAVRSDSRSMAQLLRGAFAKRNHGL